MRESLRERDALLRNAPHFVRPLPTTVPIQHVFSGLLNSAFGVLRLRSEPAERGALAVKVGLTLYDCLVARPPHACRGTSSAAATRRRRCGRTCRRRCASPPPTTTPGSAIPNGSASSSSATGSAANAGRARAQPSRRRRGREGGRLVLTDALTGDDVRGDADADRQCHRRLGRRDQCRAVAAGERARRRSSAAPRART